MMSTEEDTEESCKTVAEATRKGRLDEIKRLIAEGQSAECICPQGVFNAAIVIFHEKLLNLTFSCNQFSCEHFIVCVNTKTI